MKRVIVDHYGGPEVVQVVEDVVPKPGPGAVRVRCWQLACPSPTPSCAQAHTSRGAPSRLLRLATSWSVSSMS